jgi:hypothetical protein
VLPLIMRACGWDLANALALLQARPKNGRPLSLLARRPSGSFRGRPARPGFRLERVPIVPFVGNRETEGKDDRPGKSWNLRKSIAAGFRLQEMAKGGEGRRTIEAVGKVSEAGARTGQVAWRRGCRGDQGLGCFAGSPPLNEMRRAHRRVCPGLAALAPGPSKHGL